MGKMKISVTSEINLASEYVEQPEKLQEEIDFILNKSGEIEEFSKERDENNNITLKSKLHATENYSKSGENGNTPGI